ncbi:hypothetical protein HDU76_000864 [Blyttiomyces sp. JEL0837]|nr:hypothetical protein HDU76_000864 [Blyttiomyces sp. JEL0837]
MSKNQPGHALTTPRKRHYLSLIDRTTTPRFDITPLWTDAGALHQLTADIINHFDPDSYDVIVALDALGFLLGGALAIEASKGVVPMRKGGKLPLKPDQMISVSFTDYDDTEKTLELRKDVVPPGTKILLVDEWVGTGAQLRNAAEVLTKNGCIVVGIACLYCFPDDQRAVQLARDYDLWCANCLVCTYFDCRCFDEKKDEKTAV